MRFLLLLTGVFIGLKLIGVVGLSWLWVLSPVWLGLCLRWGFITVMLFFLLRQKKVLDK